MLSDDDLRASKASAKKPANAMRQQMDEEFRVDKRVILDDDDDDEVAMEEPQRNWRPIFIGVGIALLVVIVVIFIAMRSTPESPPPPVVVAPPTPEPVDSTLEQLQQLYLMGIGRYYIDRANLFAQGNIEADNFRRDFSQIDQPEHFIPPFQINTVTENISYTRHRAVLDAGIEVYWIEGSFQGRQVRAMIPFSLYLSLAPQGVLTAEMEVVTDATGSVTITYIRPLPPTGLLDSAQPGRR